MCEFVLERKLEAVRLCVRERECMCDVYVCDFALVCVFYVFYTEGCMGVFDMRIIIPHNVLLHST